MGYPKAPETLDKLEWLRDIRRKKGKRLAFDCFKLKFRVESCRKDNEDRVYCSLGKKLGTAKNGSMPLISVLCGDTPAVCKKCQDYED